MQQQIDNFRNDSVTDSSFATAQSSSSQPTSIGGGTETTAASTPDLTQRTKRRLFIPLNDTVPSPGQKDKRIVWFPRTVGKDLLADARRKFWWFETVLPSHKISSEGDLSPTTIQAACVEALNSIPITGELILATIPKEILFYSAAPPTAAPRNSTRTITACGSACTTAVANSEQHSISVAANGETDAMRMKRRMEAENNYFTNGLARQHFCFYSMQIPEQSFAEYLQRLMKYLYASPICFLAASWYVSQLVNKQGDQIGEEGAGAALPSASSFLYVCPRSIHRIYLAALMIAIKYLEADGVENLQSMAYYAHCGGVPTVKELAEMEMQFLAALDFNASAPIPELLNLAVNASLEVL